MRETIRLGRIFGIPVGLNWSILAIAALLAVDLAVGRYPSIYPHASELSMWAMAIFVSVMFFASVLAHELAHAVVARRYGMEVEGITLWLLGGVTKLGGDAPSGRAELRLSGAGPLTSLVLGVLFAAVAFGVGRVGPAMLADGFWWLGIINGLLAVFNVLPAAPLDGGRILSGVLWARHGDRDRAHITAARAGRVLGWILVVAGGVQLFFLDSFGGVWTGLIGWFIVGAAAMEERLARTRARLGRATVAQVMHPDPAVARGWITVDEFLARDLPWTRHRVFPVGESDGTIGGLVDVADMERVPPDRRDDVLVRDVRVPFEDVALAHPDERMADVMGRPPKGPLAHVLVFDDGVLVGMVTPYDIERPPVPAGQGAGWDVGGTSPGDGHGNGYGHPPA